MQAEEALANSEKKRKACSLLHLLGYVLGSVDFVNGPSIIGILEAAVLEALWLAGLEAGWTEC